MKFKYILLVACLSLIIPVSCTDLNVEPASELTAEKFFSDPANLVLAFGSAYTNLYHLVGHKYGLIGMDCGTDILIVPQRGGDWFDGGEWHRWHRHTIQPTEAYVERWWNICYGGINLCNQLIFQFDDPDAEVPNKDIAISELRAFRALYYYWLLDLYGNIPIVTDFDVPVDFKPETVKRPEVYDFVVSELLASLPLLSKETGINTYGRVNYYVAQMVLAKLYVNAGVYTGGSPEWDKAEAALDTIIQSNEFVLEPDYFVNFEDEGYLSNEILMGIPFDEVNADGFEIHLFTLHYNLQDNYALENQPWNGLCLQESTFDLFTPEDQRLAGLLHGFQKDIDGNDILDPSYERFDPSNPSLPRDPDGAPVNLTPAVNMLEPNCLRQAGARIAKFPFIDGTARYTSNDFPVFRYADVLLLQAEVMMNKGNVGEAESLVNQVRMRAGVDPISGLTMQDLMDERARELYAEGHRRNDMIRWGVFNNPRWEFDGADPTCANLWPIPQTQISTNDKLEQNPICN